MTATDGGRNVDVSQNVLVMS